MIRTALAAIVATALWGLLETNSTQAQRGPGAGRGFRGGAGGPSFAADRQTFHELLLQHEKITRMVTKLDNGVETITESSDPAVAKKLQEHVTAMKRRLEEGRPIRMRDPLFAELFRHAEKVTLTCEATDAGVRVTETSNDPEVVRLIQAHAAVVSQFAERGFAEAMLVHDVPAEPATSPAVSASSADRDEAAVKELQRAYAQFDRAFIPALALTDRGDAASARTAVGRLHAVARKLQATPPVAAARLPRWRAQWQVVVERCERAEQMIAAGEIKDAHETLEPLRGQLVEQRQQLDAPYALDALAAYHETMEQLVKPAAAAVAAGRPYSADEIARCRELAVAAAARWTEVELTEFSVDYLGLTPAQLQRIEAAMTAERAALAALNQALRGGDGSAAAKAARALKVPFAQLYTTFGDFATQQQHAPRQMQGERTP